MQGHLKNLGQERCQDHQLEGEMNEYTRRWRLKNPEKYHAGQKAWRENNKEKISAYNKDYYINERAKAVQQTMELSLKIEEQKLTIARLVQLCDELRQPLNNTRYHPLYKKACDFLNKLDEEADQQKEQKQ